MTVVELLIVLAIVAVAAAIAAMLIASATRTAGMQQSRAAVASALRRAAASAARSGTTTGLDLWAIPVDASVTMQSDTRLELPETALVLGSIDLQGGTGYPYSNGTNQAVAVVLQEVGDPAQAVAIVLGTSATVTEYRLVGRTWEALP